MARKIDYQVGGKVNGLTSHSWTCRTCAYHVTKLGGASAIRAGKKEANNHDCVDTSQHAEKDRKDIFG